MNDDLHHRSPDEIIRGFSAPDESSGIQRAARNARVLAWLRKLGERPLVKCLVEREYAARLGCDVTEVRDALDEVTEQADLDWMYERYGEDIEGRRVLPFDCA